MSIQRKGGIRECPRKGRGTFGLRITTRDWLMLILTRRLSETVMIGDEITVTVLSINGNQVRLGIQAPKEIPVHREEVYLRVRQENAEKQ